MTYEWKIDPGLSGQEVVWSEPFDASLSLAVIESRELLLPEIAGVIQQPVLLVDLTSVGNVSPYEVMEPVPPHHPALHEAVDDLDKELRRASICRSKLVKALQAEPDSDDPLIAQARLLERLTSAVDARELLETLKLRPGDIQDLVSKDDSTEILERFARAKEHLGLSQLEPSFQEYQRSIGGVAAPDGPRWNDQHKRTLMARLNSCAKSLCAYLTHEGHRGLLSLASGGTFQLRRIVGAGKEIVGLGQGLPLFGLSPKRPEEFR